MSPASVAVIVGGAVGQWVDRDDALALLSNTDLSVVSIAINEVGTEHPDPLEHWVSLHPNKFQKWELARSRGGLSGGYEKWTEQARPHHGTKRARTWRDGSSGLTAVDAALNEIGCAGAILCGVRMDDSPNAYRGKPWRQYKRYQHGFGRAMPHFRERVRSMSGWTLDVLGSPTPEWLAYIAERVLHHDDAGEAP